MALHQASGMIAAEDARLRKILLLRVDLECLLANSAVTRRRYRNARFVILGERGAGKTALVHALAGKQPPLSAPHGMGVYRLEQQSLPKEDSVIETREVLLWDLPNSRHYESIRRSHLANATGIVAVFDCNSLLNAAYQLPASDGSDGQAEADSDSPSRVVKVAVATKSDTLSKESDQKAVASLLARTAATATFVISTREGQGIGELRRILCSSVDWNQAPTCDSPEILDGFRSFVLQQRANGQILLSAKSLCSHFLSSDSRWRCYSFEELFDLAGVCYSLLENQGLLHRLSWSAEILLEPSYFHTYASALAAAAREDPDGLGRLPLDLARSGRSERIQIDAGTQIRDPKEERRVLRAIIAELIHLDLAYEVSTDGISYLVFPSQLTRKLAQRPERIRQAAWAECGRDGQGLYSSLVVRLLGLRLFFSEPDLYHNAAVFKAVTGGTCGLMFNPGPKPGRSEIALYFDDRAAPATREAFLRFVREHVTTLDRSGEVRWEANPQSEIMSRVSSGAAVDPRDPDKGKAFVCYERNDRDPSSVLAICRQLRDRGIRPWVDVLDLLPGQDMESARNIAIENHRVAIVFVSASHLSRSLWEQCVRLQNRGTWIIPVVLPDSPHDVAVPYALKSHEAVDLRYHSPDTIDRLVKGIIAGNQAPAVDILSRTHRFLRVGQQAGYPSQHVFLSYFRNDRTEVKRFREELSQAGHSVWWDAEIQPGKDWRTCIDEAWHRAYAAIFCFSRQSLTRESSEVYSEISSAIRIQRTLAPGAVFLIPARLDDCDLPSFRITDERWLSDLQTIDLFGADRHEQFGKLIDSLNAAKGRAYKTKGA